MTESLGFDSGDKNGGKVDSGAKNGGKVGDGIHSIFGNWKFTQEVAQNFTTHVMKSVPFYQDTQKLSIQLSEWFVKDEGIIYDIGCSTGTTIGDLVRKHLGKKVKFVGIDNSQAMVDKAIDNLKGYQNITIECDDVVTHKFPDNIDLVYSLYTLQFIPPKNRLEVLKKINNSLVNRGAIILVEKILDPDPILTDIFIQLHWQMKTDSGLNIEEVYNKSQSIRGVLTPYSIEENLQLLKDSGFTRTGIFMKWMNFIGIIGIK